MTRTVGCGIINVVCHTRDHPMRETEPTLDAVLGHLRNSLDDLRLSTDERHQFDALLDGRAADEEVLRRIRNAAFDMARERMRSGDDAMALVGWLERVMKALDVARGPVAAARTDAWFSPGDACRNAVVRQLGQARDSVRICVFTISDDRISEAIADAHRRGVAVRILTDNDKRLDAGSDIDRLRRAGVAVAEDSSPAHMHHKFAIFDDRVLQNGSFNWTRSASDRNEENLLQTTDPDAVLPFVGRFERLWKRYAQ